MHSDDVPIKTLLFNLFNLVRQLKSFLAGEELDDRIGVEDVARVDHHGARLEERHSWEVPDKM